MSVTLAHRVRRLADGQLEHYFPDKIADGFYVLGDPKRGLEKHHTTKNGIFVTELEMALHLVRTYGFSLRMRGYKTNQVNLISADKIDCL